MRDHLTLAPRVCAECETAFTFWTDRPNTDPRRYCSTACGWTAAKRKRGIEIPCKGCGQLVRVGKQKAAKRSYVVCSFACSNLVRYGDTRTRLLSRIDRSTGCWLWQGGVSKQTGYGSICDNGKKDTVHRAAYRVFIGPILEGLEIDHLCHNADPTCSGSEPCLHRRCINPEHLEAVPHRINALRGNGFMARRRRQTLAKTGEVDEMRPAM